MAISDNVEIEWRRQYPQSTVTKGEWILSIRVGQQWASKLISRYEVAKRRRENLEQQYVPDLLQEIKEAT